MSPAHDDETPPPGSEVTAGLRDEHALILRGTVALERCGARLAASAGSDPVEVDRLTALLAFFRDFADIRHHGKEEEALIPSVISSGVAPNADTLRDVMDEHLLVKELLLQLTSGDRATLVAVIPRFAGFLREHMQLEERVLFPFVERTLDAATKLRVQREFDQIDARAGTAEAFASYERLIDELLVPLNELGVSPTR